MLNSWRLSVLASAAVLSAGGCADFPGSKCESTRCAEDATIGAEVQKQIDQRAALRFANIYVRTTDHTVYLDGLVDTDLERLEAEEIASAVPGVEKVYNGLSVNGNR